MEEQGFPDSAIGSLFRGDFRAEADQLGADPESHDYIAQRPAQVIRLLSAAITATFHKVFTDMKVPERDSDGEHLRFDIALLSAKEAQRVVINLADVAHDLCDYYKGKKTSKGYNKRFMNTVATLFYEVFGETPRLLTSERLNISYEYLLRRAQILGQEVDEREV